MSAPEGRGRTAEVVIGGDFRIAALHLAVRRGVTDVVWSTSVRRSLDQRQAPSATELVAGLATRWSRL